MFDFQKITAYIKAKEFHRDIKSFFSQKDLDNTVNDRLSKASFSIALNVAEGSGRFSKADRQNFFVIARSSVFECAAILDILNDEKSIDKKEFEEFSIRADELSRILFTMIKNLT